MNPYTQHKAGARASYPTREHTSASKDNKQGAMNKKKDNKAVNNQSFRATHI